VFIPTFWDMPLAALALFNFDIKVWPIKQRRSSMVMESHWHPGDSAVAKGRGRTLRLSARRQNAGHRVDPLRWMWGWQHSIKWDCGYGVKDWGVPQIIHQKILRVHLEDIWDIETWNPYYFSEILSIKSSIKIIWRYLKKWQTQMIPDEGWNNLLQRVIGWFNGTITRPHIFDGIKAMDFCL